jgi:putative transposase
MNTSPRVSSVTSYKGHRFPAEIISHCVWLYFPLRVVVLSIQPEFSRRRRNDGRARCRGQLRNDSGMVSEVRTVVRQTPARGRGRLGDRWHLDEVFLKIQGKLQYLWRAVDQDGEVLDILVQSRRNKRAAKKFFRKLLKGLQYVPRAIITDKLRSYAAAKVEVIPSVEHQQQGRLNNRAENSHQPTRERERRMRGFKSPGHAQRFLSTFGVTASFFRPGRHLLAVRNYHEIMRRRFTQWRELVGVQPAI